MDTERVTQLYSLAGKNFFHADHVYDGLAPSSWAINNRIIDSLHIIMILHGRGMYYVGDNQLPLQPGRIIAVNSNVAHSSRMDGANRLYFLTSRFNCIDKNGKIVPLDFLFNAEGFLDIKTIRPEFYTALLRQIYQHHTLEQKGNRTKAKSALYFAMLSELIVESEKNSCSPQANKDIDKLCQIIISSPAKRMSLQEMADICGMSTRSFSSSFRNVTGFSPNNFQIHVRCEKAKLMLEDTALSIKQIAFELGYPNPFSFSLQFSKFTGRTPKNLRNVLH